MLTRLTQLTLLAAILVSAGCAHHHHHGRDRGDDGWRGRGHRWQDGDRRYDERRNYRRDDRRYRDDD